MAAFLDNCRFNPTAGGTTDWTYFSAVSGYQSPTAAGVVNGTLYKYFAISSDLSQWEVGEGAYNTGTGVLARTTVLYNSAGTTAKINFTTVPTVAIVALKEDIISIQEANSFTTAQKSQARTNIGAAQSGGATASATPTNPTATTSGTGVMMGLGSSCTLTPATTGKVLVSWYFIGSNTAATGSTQPSAYYGTGTAPINGAATTGTAAGGRLSGQSINANSPLPFGMSFVVTGLTVGTAYWFDINILAGGGTASITTITFSAAEIP